MSNKSAPLALMLPVAARASSPKLASTVLVEETSKPMPLQPSTGVSSPLASEARADEPLIASFAASHAAFACSAVASSLKEASNMSSLQAKSETHKSAMRTAHKTAVNFFFIFYLHGFVAYIIQHNVYN